MEGKWRGVARWVALVSVIVLAAAVNGCGDDDPSAASAGGVHTSDPERTFAPQIEIADYEHWRPMSARWFIERSTLIFAEDQGCPDRRIAVGHTLPELRTDATNWIFPLALGKGLGYYRSPDDAQCDLNSDLVFYANQLTRPRDPGNRAEGIRPTEGFFLDLADGARHGPPVRGEPGTYGDVPVYSERTDEGDGSVRLTYWLLFGMNGTPGEQGAHEGDWERVDVLLDDDGDSRYTPLRVQVGGEGGDDFAWAETRKVDGSHPVVESTPDSHEMWVTPPGEGCGGCLRLEAWRVLASVKDQPWYGFGGAWGELGPTSAATGPLGPHDHWPTAEEKARELEKLEEQD